MSEKGWSSEAVEAKPPKRRVPGWVWGCGAGCGLLLLVGVLGLALAINMVRKAANQDLQWERVSKVLPFEQRPAGIHVIGFPFKLEGMSMWFLTDRTRGLFAVLFSAPPGKAASETKRELFDLSGQENLQGPFGSIDKTEIEPGKVSVGGRELSCVRFNSKQDSAGSSPFSAFQASGATIAVDLSAPGSDELLALMLIQPEGAKRVSDEVLREFLAPFGIPGSQPQIAPGEAATPPDPAGNKEDR